MITDRWCPEPERIRQHDIDLPLARRQRHEIDRSLHRRVVEIDGRGATLSRIARMLKIVSTPGRASRCPVDDLVEDIDTLEAALPSSRSTAPSSISSPICVEVRGH